MPAPRKLTEAQVRLIRSKAAARESLLREAKALEARRREVWRLLEQVPTQPQLAQECGIHWKTVNKIVRGTIYKTVRP
jgi:DNA-binding NarL/FixJ family response regulator